jgi:nicotinamide riboside transporter PnuC
MPGQDQVVQSAQVVVRVARIANRVFLGAVVAGLVGTWVFAAPFAAMADTAIPGMDGASALTPFRLVMLIGVAMSVATDCLFNALSLMIATATDGDPFIADNASRLQTIGWCLLVLQLMEIPGMLIAKYFPDLGSAGPSGEISIAGWIAVLMVFVLSRVFTAGTQMRDDLAGTV